MSPPEFAKLRFHDCPAALIVISGETTCTGKDGKYSTMTCTNVASGVWQVTSPDGIPISSGCTFADDTKSCLASSKCNNKIIDTDVCCQADFVNSHLYTNVGYNIASLGMFNNGYGYCNWKAGPSPTQSVCANDNSKTCTRLQRIKIFLFLYFNKLRI